MLKNADEKRIKILEVAKKRFSHYGMAKTTMAEIAKDLAFSKALLYYYFPDKNSLFYAVLAYIVEEDFKPQISKAVEGITDVEEAVLALLNNRIWYIKQYYYLFEHTFIPNKAIAPELDNILIGLFEWQKTIVSDLLAQGMKRGELAEQNPDELAELLLLSLMGVRYIVIKDLKSNFVPTKEDFDYILSMQIKVTKIFVQGLKI